MAPTPFGTPRPMLSHRFIKVALTVARAQMGKRTRPRT